MKIKINLLRNVGGEFKRKALRTPETITELLLTGSGFHVVRNSQTYIGEHILFLDKMFLDYPTCADGYLFISDEEWEKLESYIDQNNIKTSIVEYESPKRKN